MKNLTIGILLILSALSGALIMDDINNHPNNKGEYQLDLNDSTISLYQDGRLVGTINSDSCISELIVNDKL